MKQDDDLRKSIVQQIMQKSTEMRRIIVPNEGQGGVTLSRVSPQCHRYPLVDYIWWVSMGHGDVSER